MSRCRSVPEVEADLSALKVSAERAGLALACAFSSSTEYEADLIRERRAQGVYRPRRHWSNVAGSIVLTLFLAAIFLMM
jgi:hypothetical protein